MLLIIRSKIKLIILTFNLQSKLGDLVIELPNNMIPIPSSDVFSFRYIDFRFAVSL